MAHQRIIAVGLAAVWGVLATWIVWWLFDSVAGALLIASDTSVKAMVYNGWTTEQIKPYLSGLIAVVPALVCGAVFGLPLGLFTQRSVIVEWLTFVVAFIFVLAVRMLLAGYDIYGMLENLASAPYLLTLLVTLFFAFICHRARLAHVNRRVAA